MEIKELRSQPADVAARRLLGSQLIVNTNDGTSKVCVITETESYSQHDPASHSFNGRTDRNQSMFLEGGHAYVYLIYGIHYCLNIVTGMANSGEAVLLRGGVIDGVHIEGPGRLTKTLGIDLTYDGHNLSHSPLKLVLKEPIPSTNIISSKRVGISKNAHDLLNFKIDKQTITQFLKS